MLEARNSNLVFRGALLVVSLGLVSAFALAVPRPSQQTAASSPQRQTQASSAQTEEPSSAKPDAKKAKAAYARGQQAERTQNWQDAYDAYVEALEEAPSNHEYLVRRELTKGRLIQAKEELAERDAVAGKLGDARKALLEASYLDPSDHSISDRLAQLTDLEPKSADELRQQPEITGPVHLDYSRDKQNINVRGDTRSAYEALAKLFGVDVAFDVDLHSAPVQLRLDNIDFLTAVDILGQMTHTFWQPVTKRLFSVAEDTQEKRKDYETQIVRTIQIPASETVEQMQDLFRLVREVATQHATIDTVNRTITLRGDARSVAIASDLVENLEQPIGEVMLDIEVLEVDRNYAPQIGITPPQTATVYSIASQQLNEAEHTHRSRRSAYANIRYAFRVIRTDAGPNRERSLIGADQCQFPGSPKGRRVWRRKIPHFSPLCPEPPAIFRKRFRSFTADAASCSVPRRRAGQFLRGGKVPGFARAILVESHVERQHDSDQLPKLSDQHCSRQGTLRHTSPQRACAITFRT